MSRNVTIREMRHSLQYVLVYASLQRNFFLIVYSDCLIVPLISLEIVRGNFGTGDALTHIRRTQAHLSSSDRFQVVHRQVRRRVDPKIAEALDYVRRASKSQFAKDFTLLTYCKLKYVFRSIFKGCVIERTVSQQMISISSKERIVL